jgi:hypothetical protein
VIISGNGNGNVGASSNSGPNEAWNLGGPAGENLHSERDRVDVWNVVSDDGERCNDHAEAAEPPEVVDENCTEKTAYTPVVKGVTVAFVVYSGGCDNCTKEFAKQERDEQTGHGGKVHTDTVGGDWLIAGVVGGIRAPTDSKAENNGSKGEHGTRFSRADWHGNGIEVTRVAKNTNGDEQDAVWVSRVASNFGRTYINTGNQAYFSYEWTTLYPKRQTTNVRMAMMTIPTAPLTLELMVLRN